jgi:hypothetical protein
MLLLLLLLPPLLLLSQLPLLLQLFWRTKCKDFNVKTCFVEGGISKAFKKTFVERQSWVLVLFSFWRVYAFHIVAIHVMINLARCDLGTSAAACSANQLLQPVTTMYACMLLKDAHDFIEALIMFRPRRPHRSVQSDSTSCTAATAFMLKLYTILPRSKQWLYCSEPVVLLHLLASYLHVKLPLSVLLVMLFKLLLA